MPLRTDIRDANSYILLNGGSGDFCYKSDVDNPDDKIYQSLSWSSNTKNFVLRTTDYIYINNWKNNHIEKIPVDTVDNNLIKFYNYLINSSFRTESDVVPYVMDLFRRLRNATKEQQEPVITLNLLFLLLSSLEDDINNFDFPKWGLPEMKIPAQLELYSSTFKRGVMNIPPNLNTLLRHSAGVLFQEAQKEILLFDPQMDLWSQFSNKLVTKKILYSSIHYTPAYLSRAIVEHTLKNLDFNQPNVKIFDPACGSGEFLVEALRQLDALGYLGIIEIIGWDSAQTAINTSNYLLTYEKRTIWGDRLNFQINLVEDSLSEIWEKDFDFIFMNPPFVSWEHLSIKSRESLAATIGLNIKGKPNQASGFLAKAVESIKQGGIVGSILPTTILTLDTYTNVRSDIKEICDLLLVGKLGNFIFEDALTDVSILIAQKKHNSSLPLVIWTRNEKGAAKNALRDLRKMIATNALAVEKNEYSIFTPEAFPISKKSWRPISISEVRILKDIKIFEAKERLVPVSKIFDVKQGVRTGKNSAFIISEKDLNDLPSTEWKYFRPILNNDSIFNSKIIVKEFIWYPYDSNGIVLKSENDLATSVPSFYGDHLMKYRKDLINLARKTEANWWHLSEHRAWLRKHEPRICSGEFGSSSSFVFDKEGKYIVERGNAWLPKKEFQSFDYYYFYLAFFTSTIFDKLLSIYSKELAGGKWYDLGKQYTKDIPIPNIYNDELRESKACSRLIDLGKELVEEERPLKSAIDEILRNQFYPC